PAQRNAPFTAGAIVKNGAVTGSGMRPSATIGSANTTRISFASSRVASSPSGPALRTRNSAAQDGATSPIVAHASRTAVFIVAMPPEGPRVYVQCVRQEGCHLQAPANVDFR